MVKWPLHALAGYEKSSPHWEFILEVLSEQHPGGLKVELLSLESFSGLIITHDKSCENSETKASSPIQWEGLSVPISVAGEEICMCCIWDVQHGSHQAPFPPFKHIKTSLQLQHFCASPELLQMPVLKGCKGLRNSLSPLCTKR